MRRILTNDYLAAVCDTVRFARVSCFIAAYQLKLAGSWRSAGIRQLVDLMAKARARGADVRVILNGTDPIKGSRIANAHAARELKKLEIPTRRPERNITMHSKMIVVDGLYTILGSHNLSHNSLFRNLETSIWIKDARVANDAGVIFKLWWNEAVDFPVQRW